MRGLRKFAHALAGLAVLFWMAQAYNSFPALQAQFNQLNRAQQRQAKIVPTPYGGPMDTYACPDRASSLHIPTPPCQLESGEFVLMWPVRKPRK